MSLSTFALFPCYYITTKGGVLTDSFKSTSSSPCPRLKNFHSNKRAKVTASLVDNGESYPLLNTTINYMKLQELKQVKSDTTTEKADDYSHVGRRRSIMMCLLMPTLMSLQANLPTPASALTPIFREYIDTFDGYSFKYPQNWIQVRGAGADIFFRDPVVLDENMSVEFSSPSSSKYQSLEDLGSPEEAGKRVLRQYLTEFMSTRLGVKREANILTTSSRVADDGKLYYQVEVNIKSYANNNELAVMPQDRVARLEWDRRYLAVLGVENNRLYSMRLQTPERVFQEEEKDLRRVMDSFRVEKI